jgi:hypothetical protein
MKIKFLAEVIVIVILLYFINSLSTYFIPNPSMADLAGKYKISTWDIGVDSPIIELKENGGFTLSKTTHGLCLAGTYEITPEFEGCSISFRCSQLIACATIRKSLFGYKISFLKYSEEEDLFEKI